LDSFNVNYKDFIQQCAWSSQEGSCHKQKYLEKHFLAILKKDDLKLLKHEKNTLQMTKEKKKVENYSTIAA